MTPAAPTRPTEYAAQSHHVSNGDALRIASVNLQDGGLDPHGGASRLEQSAAALLDLQPHIVLAQEICAPGEDKIRQYYRALANAVGLEPAALGPARGSKRQRCGILVDTNVFQVLDDGPPLTSDAPLWAEAVVSIRATGTVLAITSVHSPSTTGLGQLTEAQRLATRTAQRGMLAVAGGDWNCYTPADGLTEEEIGILPPDLRPSRTIRSDGRLAANYAVHDTLCDVGMVDPIPELPPHRRNPPEPPGTGSHPRARIDRFYLWTGAQIVPVTCCYHQIPNPGSDHQLCMICLSLAALVAIKLRPS